MTKPRAKSIRFRLTAAYTGVLAVTFVLIGIAVWIALEHSIQATADRELHSRLIDVRRYIDSFSADDLLHLEEEFREESLLSQSVANIRVSDPKGKWLFHTHSTDLWPAQTLNAKRLSTRGHIITIHAGKERIRVLTAPVRVGVIQIGLSIDQFEEVKNGFFWLMLLGSPVLLALACMGGYWLSGRALRPVDEISRAAAQISVQDLAARLPGTGIDDELDRLARVLNEMLSRLESAFKRIAEFTADASHELRTPVAIIQTTAELMLSRPRSIAEHITAWNSIKKETERTSHLIADLLTLARLDSGNLDFVFQPIDLSEIARAAVGEMDVIAEARQLQLLMDASHPCPVEGDAEALLRVVCILLDNAIKFSTAPSAIRVAVKNGAAASITVSDQGCGIAAADLPRVFDRFYRASKDRSRKTGGVGLGLSIAREIVERHGGRLTADSQPGQGCDFTVSLPHQGKV